MMQEVKEEFPARKRKKDVDLLRDSDDLIADIITQMMKAAEEDKELKKKKKAAIKKLNLLPMVLSQLGKPNLQMAFLQQGILNAMAEWLRLSPPKNTLPHQPIRQGMLKQLTDFGNIDQSFLKASEIERAVKCLFEHPRENKDNRAIAGRLISEWTTSLLNVASTSRQSTNEEQEQIVKDHGKRNRRKEMFLMQKKKKENLMRRRTNNVDPISDSNYLVANIVTQMMIAAEEDKKLKRKKKVAPKKLNLLPMVLSQLGDQNLQKAFIEQGVLNAIAEWLSPFPRKSLPHRHIRECMLKQLTDFGDIDQSFLKASNIGRAVMGLFMHPRETEENRAIAGRLISQWTVLLFNPATNPPVTTIEVEEQIDQDHTRKHRKTLIPVDEGWVGRPKVWTLIPEDEGWVGRASVSMPSTSKSYQSLSITDAPAPAPVPAPALAPDTKILNIPPATRDVALHERDLLSLEDRRFLKHEVADFYLNYVFYEKISIRKRQKIHIFSSLFYSGLINVSSPQQPGYDVPKAMKVRRHNQVKTWTQRVDIFSKDHIIVPVHQNNHWVLAIIRHPCYVFDTSVVKIEPESDSETELSVSSADGQDTSEVIIKEELKEEDVQNQDENSTFTIPLDVEKEPSELDDDDASLEISGSSTHLDGNVTSHERNRQRKGTLGPCIVIFDSLRDQNGAGNIVSILREYLEMEWETRKGTKNVFDGKTMPGFMVTNIQHRSSSEYGLYMLLQNDSYFKDPIPCFENIVPILTNQSSGGI